jgi:hypothetical protein
VLADAIAFAPSLLVGQGLGILAATADVVDGVRPRNVLRLHPRLAGRLAVILTALGVTLGAAGVADAARLRVALGITCAAAAFLLALATWVLLIEPDDEGGDRNGLDEPKWWPQFESDLHDWIRRTRIPAGPRV